MDKGSMDKGLVHLYWGKGKGKTTAAAGLALRALGSGLRVVFLQFLKNGESGEIKALEQLGAVIYSGSPDTKFLFQMTEEEKETLRALHTQNLQMALGVPCDLLVLDEACAAWQTGMTDKALLQKAVMERPLGREVVLTGREPADWMFAAADYSTEMDCHKHPFEQGIRARKGVEF